jgi:hypothetical protein
MLEHWRHEFTWLRATDVWVAACDLLCWFGCRRKADEAEKREKMEERQRKMEEARVKKKEAEEAKQKVRFIGAGGPHFLLHLHSLHSVLLGPWRFRPGVAVWNGEFSRRSRRRRFENLGRQSCGLVWQADASRDWVAKVEAEARRMEESRKRKADTEGEQQRKEQLVRPGLIGPHHNPSIFLLGPHELSHPLTAPVVMPTDNFRFCDG